jgi:3-hydroxybutyryl-CoA dehydrogenase
MPQSFFRCERNACGEPERTDKNSQMEIRTIGVIGAGPLGQGIACAAALAGYATVLEDVLPEMREQGIALICSTLEAAAARGEIAPAEESAAVANLSTAATVEDVCRVADLLIDALPEELELKLEIFTIFDKFAKPNAVLASATSTIPIADLAEMTYRAENCIGMCFVDPVAGRKHLEIIRAPGTSDATAKAAVEVARRMGKEAVIIREAPPAASAAPSAPERAAKNGGRA